MLLIIVYLCMSVSADSLYGGGGVNVIVVFACEQPSRI